MKKVGKLLLVLFISLSLMACSKEENEPIPGNNDAPIENTDNSENQGDADDLENLNLYSDDTKIVFNFNDVYNIVYYYEGNEITGMEYYYNYQTSEVAAYAKAGIEASKDENVESVIQKGQYIIVKFNEKEYNDYTLEEIKQTYSYLEEVKKGQ